MRELRHDRDEREQRDTGREHRQTELRVLSSSRGWGLMSPPRPSSRSGSARATMPVCVDLSPSTSGARVAVKRYKC